jgi:hypothetical protein
MGKRTVKRYCFISPPFQSAMMTKAPQPVASVNEQLKHLLWDGDRLPWNDPPSSSINQQHLLIGGYLEQVQDRTGGQNERLTSTATVWLFRKLHCSHTRRESWSGNHTCAAHSLLVYSVGMVRYRMLTRPLCSYPGIMCCALVLLSALVTPWIWYGMYPALAQLPMWCTVRLPFRSHTSWYHLFSTCGRIYDI